MRNLNLEAAIWELFSSLKFFDAAAQELNFTMKWFGDLARLRKFENFGRNGQVFDKLKSFSQDLRRGAELAKLGDYQLMWDLAGGFGSDVRGMMEQPLHSWMTEAEYKEFGDIRIGRILSYVGNIERVLNNAMLGADSYLDDDPDYAERRNDDDGFPGDSIVDVYSQELRFHKDSTAWKVPDPLSDYKIDTKTACRTGDEVPWTGVWFPSVGLENHSLTFAIKGTRMQAVYRVVKTIAEVEVEGEAWPYPETIIEAATWHPLIPLQRSESTDMDLWAKAGQPCPKAGLWQPTDPGVAPRAYQLGESMSNLRSVYGFTIWKWIADR